LLAFPFNFIIVNSIPNAYPSTTYTYLVWKKVMPELKKCKTKEKDCILKNAEKSVHPRFEGCKKWNGKKWFHNFLTNMGDDCFIYRKFCLNQNMRWFALVSVIKLLNVLPTPPKMYHFSKKLVISYRLVQFWPHIQCYTTSY